MGSRTFTSRAGKYQGLIINSSFQILTLFKEFVLSLIGIASALGQQLTIPIVIRTLADSLAFVQDENLPFHPDSQFLDTLDAGNHELVPSYKLQWWTGRKPKDLGKVEILGASTVRACLSHFRDQKLKATVLPAGAGAGSTSSPAGSTSLPAGSTSLHAGSTLLPGAGQCQSCNKYRQLLSDVLQDILKFESYASLMSTSSENLLNIGIRKASIFNQLHEAAILKESDSVPPPAKATKAHHIAETQRRASSELKRLEDLPASSYKWTWGETLTKEEVLKLRRIGTRPGKVPHSGYDISLAEGQMKGKDSSGPSALNSSLGKHEELPAEATISIPSTNFQHPHFYKSNPDHRLVYNPFRVSEPASHNSAPHNSSALDIADKWTSGSGSPESPATRPGEIAAVWTSGSEAGSAQVPPSAAEENEILQMADAWEDEDRVEDESGAQAPPSAAEKNEILQMADAWEDEDREDEDAGANPAAPASSPAIQGSTPVSLPPTLDMPVI